MFFRGPDAPLPLPPQKTCCFGRCSSCFGIFEIIANNKYHKQNGLGGAGGGRSPGPRCLGAPGEGDGGGGSRTSFYHFVAAYVPLLNNKNLKRKQILINTSSHYVPFVLEIRMTFKKNVFQRPRCTTPTTAIKDVLFWLMFVMFWHFRNYSK